MDSMMTVKRRGAYCGLLMVMLSVCGLFGGADLVWAHCQVPCGIYHDNARVKILLENVMTVDKAVSEIQILSGKRDALSVNQAVRWVMNKEQHAQTIIQTISDYFLTQRVKPKQKDYAKRLLDHHQVIVAAMKVKQTVDTSAVDDLREAVQALEAYYPKPHKH